MAKHLLCLATRGTSLLLLSSPVISSFHMNTPDDASTSIVSRFCDIHEATIDGEFYLFPPRKT